jgi:hypothetical protein
MFIGWSSKKSFFVDRIYTKETRGSTVSKKDAVCIYKMYVPCGVFISLPILMKLVFSFRCLMNFLCFSNRTGLPLMRLNGLKDTYIQKVKILSQVRFVCSFFHWIPESFPQFVVSLTISEIWEDQKNYNWLKIDIWSFVNKIFFLKI